MRLCCWPVPVGKQCSRKVGCNSKPTFSPLWPTHGAAQRPRALPITAATLKLSLGFTKAATSLGATIR